MSPDLQTEQRDYDILVVLRTAEGAEDLVNLVRALWQMRHRFVLAQVVALALPLADFIHHITPCVVAFPTRQKPCWCPRDVAFAGKWRGVVLVRAPPQLYAHLLFAVAVLVAESSLAVGGLRAWIPAHFPVHPIQLDVVTSTYLCNGP